MMFAAAAVITLQSLLDHARTHIHIPETTAITIVASERSPMDPPHMKPGDGPLAWVEDRRWGYRVSLRASTLTTRTRDQLQWTVFHELCHVVYDYDYIANWGALSEVDRRRREDRATVCAHEVMTRHNKECK